MANLKNIEKHIPIYLLYEEMKKMRKRGVQPEILPNTNINNNFFLTFCASIIPF